MGFSLSFSSVALSLHPISYLTFHAHLACLLMCFEVYAIGEAKAAKFTIIFVNYVDVMLIKTSSVSEYVRSRTREYFGKCVCFPVGLDDHTVVLRMIKSVKRGTLCFSVCFIFKLADLHASRMKHTWCKLCFIFWHLGWSNWT